LGKHSGLGGLSPAANNGASEPKASSNTTEFKLRDLEAALDDQMVGKFVIARSHQMNDR